MREAFLQATDTRCDVDGFGNASLVWLVRRRRHWDCAVPGQFRRVEKVHRVRVAHVLGLLMELRRNVPGV